MHRNTLLLVSFLAVIAALLVGMRIGRSLVPQNTQLPTPTQQPTPTLAPVLLNYTDPTCGISLMYPSSLTRLDATGSAMFVSSTNASDSVALVCQRNIPRPLVASGSAETTSVANLSAKLYHDTTGPDKSPIDKIIFTNPKTGLDVLLAGKGPIFDAMVKSLILR